MEIETPPGAYAFVAANLLTKAQSAAPAPVLTKPAQPQPVPPPPAPIAPPPVVEKKVEPAPVVENRPPKTEPPTQVAPQAPPPVIATAPTPAPLEPKPEPTVTKPSTTPASPETPPKRIVRREGVVRGTVSIQAPTYYELVGPDSSRVINYLHLNDAILEKLGTSIREFKDYKGRSIVVTGEEGIDPRWPSTPVIEVETLKLVL